MIPLPAFDEIHVISDLHMGGKPGFQILRETDRLANFVRWVGTQRRGGQVALVLNGDVIDTLAEDGADYIAIDDAVETVTRIIDDPAFSPVWAALADLVHLDGRHLVIILGNHDIELAFPPVQRMLRERLAGTDLSAWARIEFSTAGAGYTCRIGGRRVYCIHGNEVDAWNYNRYEDIAKVSRRINAGRSLSQDEWKPNAGTKMVKDVMNEVKRRYAWIDLLKPETAAAVGTLLVLDPSQSRKVAQMFGIVGERTSGASEIDRRLSLNDFRPQAKDVAPIGMEQILGPNLRQAVAPSTDEMLLTAERSYELPSTSALDTNQQLGTGQLILDRLTGWITGVGKDEALRRALIDWLEGDTTFNIDDQDDTFKQVHSSVGESVDFIVTGHTHLERAIDIGGRFYFNTGTWIRLLRFTEDMLRSTDSFKEIFDVLIDGRMQTIDEARLGGLPFVLDRTSSVSIKLEGAEVVGRLLHVVGDGRDEPGEVARFSKTS